MERQILERQRAIALRLRGRETGDDRERE